MQKPMPQAQTSTPPQSDLLARWTYQNAELLQLEKQKLFREQWMLVGHVGDIPQPLDYLTWDAVGECVLVIRGEDNRIRAFYNACRHRGVKVLREARGKCAAMFSCPFHGWTYRSNGELAAVPAKHTFADLDLRDNGLLKVDLDVWMGLIFIRLQGDAPPPSEALRPLNDLVAPYRIEEMQNTLRVDETRACNWKVIHDVDNEGYHIPVGHPALQQLYGADYRDELIGGIGISRAALSDKAAKNWSVRHYQKLLPDYSHLPEQSRRAWFYITLFPNAVLALYPDSVEYYMTLPLEVARTRYIDAVYALDDANRNARAARYLSTRINALTDIEDRRFVDGLQRALSSAAPRTPKLSSLEEGVRRFHHAIQALIPAAKLAAPPPAGELAEINRQLGAADC